MTRDGASYQVSVACKGIPHGIGPEAAEDIEREFTAHRPWQARPRCTYAHGTLTLTDVNGFDPGGTALLDEFLDAVAAYVGGHGPGSVVGVRQV